MLNHIISYSSAVLCVTFCLTTQFVPVTNVPVGVTVPGGQRSKNVRAIMQAIIGQESAWNYRAVNPHSGALGFAQVMPANLPGWTKAAVGRSVSREEFLSSPAIQVKTAEYIMGGYYDAALTKAGGDARVAARMVGAAWYGGPGNMVRHRDTAIQYYNGHAYPSFNDYSNGVERGALRYGLK